MEGTRTSPGDNGVYEGQVSVNGIPKTGNGGMSTFFPEEMTPQQVVDTINEAYSNKTLVNPAPAPGMNSTYQGTTSGGIDVTMYIKDAGKIVSAFPGGN
ncbi:MAG: EndoU domain-containing protein [Bacteroidales bacterium]|nr:EndoU domain-containing protein [Bacteroidales bacterium]